MGAASVLTRFTLVALVTTSGARAACPVGTVVAVDNDVAGSGYSEVKPENWVSNSVDACKGTYRYLSAYVGDGTRKGKAIWKPKLTVAGSYRVETSFRASANRTNDADYFLYDDKGGTQKRSVDQRGNGCTKVVIGSAYCAVGGDCRLVLDGDDGQSDAADVTTFTLESCDDPGDAGAPSPCSGIVAVSAYELCEETPTTCAGVFTDGSGCTAFCAAAGMVCSARFGGEPGCSKEATFSIPCGASNGHASDFCECTLPPGSGGTGGTTSGAAGAGNGGAAAGSTGSDASALGGSGGGWSGGAGVAMTGGTNGVDRGGVVEEAEGCGCRAAGSRTDSGAFVLAALGAGAYVAGRRNRARRARG